VTQEKSTLAYLAGCQWQKRKKFNGVDYRPVVFLAFSDYNEEDSANYYMISACKGKVKKNAKIVLNQSFSSICCKQ
jgi:hypothetical protein